MREGKVKKIEYVRGIENEEIEDGEKVFKGSKVIGDEEKKGKWVVRKERG